MIQNHSCHNLQPSPTSPTYLVNTTTMSLRIRNAPQPLDTYTSSIQHQLYLQNVVMGRCRDSGRCTNAAFNCHNESDFVHDDSCSVAQDLSTTTKGGTANTIP